MRDENWIRPRRAVAEGVEFGGAMNLATKYEAGFESAFLRDFQLVK